MQRLFLKLVLFAGAIVAWHHLAGCESVQAQVPSYYTLRAPAPAMHHGGHGYNPGQAQPVSRHAYAYGYFGAQPRRHWSRHFGYYREYTQWSVR